jgi:N-acetylglucosaminyldiphosphoundecaprenol N-acetyl-beta-D-mannosaminyltransferase
MERTMDVKQTVSFPSPIRILGSRVTPFESYGQAVDFVEDRLSRGQKLFCVAINPEKVYRAAHNTELNRILGQADMGICDGVGIAIAAKLLYGESIPRCTGVDLFYQLVRKAAERRWKVFLLGATPETNEKACANLCRQYPTLQIVGRQHGYFESSSAVIDQINASEANIVFVAMGTPRQEFWIAENRAKIKADFLMGVGGTFDVVSGSVRRAPAIFRKTGTEFLYRLISNPGRWRRQIVLPLFAISVLKDRFRHRRNRAGTKTENLSYKQF